MNSLRTLRDAVALSIALLAPGIVLADCPVSYPFTDNNVDYLSPSAQARIRGIESNHLNAGVENLERGQSTANVGGDLRFILSIIPNHHRAMNALMRLALRDKTETPAESGPLTVKCWLHRATVFSPDDGQSYLVHGVYLARLGQKLAALEQLQRAFKLMPDDANVNYNLGLVYFDDKKYESALEHAKRAYAAGFPLPGLRQKLIQAGQWRE